MSGQKIRQIALLDPAPGCNCLCVIHIKFYVVGKLKKLPSALNFKTMIFKVYQ